MGGISIPLFGGMVPRQGNQVLANQSADFAQNCLLLSGESRSLHAPIELKNFDNGTWAGNEVTWVFRIPPANSVPDDVEKWVPFGEERVEFLGGPLINDMHDRYYYTRSGHPPAFSANSPSPGGVSEPSDFEDSESKPTFDANDGSQLTGLKSRVLGVPAPPEENIPTLSVSGGTTPVVTRAYVWTVSNNFGEESAPSEPVVATGNDSGTWTIGNMVMGPDLASKYNLTHKNIYRTVTGSSGSADYFWVAQVSISTTSYADSSETGEVSLNDPLETYLWQLPPDDLIGLTLHPNGFFVGFVGKELYFSEAYRPHAWPANYVISTEHEIVGIGVYGATLAVITKGHPYVCTGITPASLTLTKYQSSEPCTHFRGIVPVMGGVVFPTFNGLKLMSPTGVTELSKQFLTRDEWQSIDYNNIFATRFNTQYVGFYSASEGFLFEPSDAVAGFSMLGEFWNMKNLQTDPYSGEVWMVFGGQEGEGNIVAHWNPPTGVPLSHIWRSKEFVVPKPINLGICQLDWEPNEIIENPIAAEASTLRSVSGNLPADVAAHGKVFPGKMPIPEYTQPPKMFNNGVEISALAELRLRVWADGVLVYDNIVETTRSIRLPKGFKAIRWQFEFSGNATLRHAKFAETGASLATL